MDSPEQIFARAQALHRLGQLREAEPLYRAVLELAPTDGFANHRLGMLLLQSNRADEAEPVLRRSVAAPQTAAEAMAHLGLALHQLGRFEEALDCLERADAAGLGARLPLWRASTRVELGRLEAARADLDCALAMDPGFTEARLHHSRLRLLLDEEPGAPGQARPGASRGS